MVEQHLKVTKPFHSSSLITIHEVVIIPGGEEAEAGAGAGAGGGRANSQAHCHYLMAQGSPGDSRAGGGLGSKCRQLPLRLGH